MRDLAVDPSNSSIVYALAVVELIHGRRSPGGTSECRRRRDVGAAQRRYRSSTAHALALDPASPATLYLATSLTASSVTNGAARGHRERRPDHAVHAIDRSRSDRARSRLRRHCDEQRLRARLPGDSALRRDGDPCNDDDPCTMNDCVQRRRLSQYSRDVRRRRRRRGVRVCDAGAANGTPASCCAAARQLAHGRAARAADDGDLCSIGSLRRRRYVHPPDGHDPLCVAPATRGAS